jgi:hypothetical protein
MAEVPPAEGAVPLVVVPAVVAQSVVLQMPWIVH